MTLPSSTNQPRHPTKRNPRTSSISITYNNNSTIRNDQRTIPLNVPRSRPPASSSPGRRFVQPAILVFAILGVFGLLIFHFRTTLATTTISSIRSNTLIDGNVMTSSVGASTTTNKTTTVFSLFVTLQFTANEHLQQFLRDLQPVADHVREYEPDTLSYEVLLSDKDPLRVLVMERYRNRDHAYLVVHKSSTPFLEFRPKLQAMIAAGYVAMSGESYLDANVGFGDRT